ncbi:MAG: DUF1700 domain-containing protein [Clostridia bacterium]|nr:DUF1700 domain-containing protein [Clostridia bacterium]
MKMTKNEYLGKLEHELNKNRIADKKDILSEYEQHFAFKLADGFTEEEIAAKLGAPEVIAAQFENEKRFAAIGPGGRLYIKVAMSVFAVFEALIFILFFAWVVAVAVASMASAVVGVSLIGLLNPAGLLPFMPYTSALILGICLLAFSVLLAVAAFYFFAFSRQIVRAVVRWHKNVISGGGLPQVPWSPQFYAKTRRSMRTVLLVSVIVFGVSFVLGYAVSAFSAGALGFWHVWNWFV